MGHPVHIGNLDRWDSTIKYLLLEGNPASKAASKAGAYGGSEVGAAVGSMVGPPVIGGVVGNIIGERVGQDLIRETGLDRDGVGTVEMLGSV